VHVDQGVVAEQQRRRDDLPAGPLDDPRVAIEVQAGRRPVRVEVLDREVGVADVGDVARQQDAQDGLVVGPRRRAEGVVAGKRGATG